MIFKIEYHELVVKEDIPKLPKQIKERMRRAIEEKLSTKPEVFGKPLRKSLKGFRSLRVGNHRVIFRIEGKTVKIFVIQPRSVVYSKAGRRFVRR